MRVEHYATQAAGLDLTFDISSALFFATHKFEWDARGLAYYREIPRGEHQGIIYLFRFGSPSVNLIAVSNSRTNKSFDKDDQVLA